MTSRQPDFRAVILDGTRYRIEEKILSELAPQTAEPVTIGPASSKNLRNRNTLIWNDFHKGNGLREILDLEEDLDQPFWSYAGLRTLGHTVLPPLATKTAIVTGSPTSASTLGVRNSEVYATINGTLVHKFDNAGDSWGSSLKTLPAAATDVINVRMVGTEYIVWATTTGYTYYNGSSFVDDTHDTKFLAFWDGRLWGITNGGALFWAKVIGADNEDAQLPLPDGAVQGLFVGRSTNGGRLVLYASTNQGLYVHDADSNSFELVDPSVPEHQDNGLGHTRFLESIFYSAGMGVYRYINQPSRADLSVMGLDRQGGLIADHVGTIDALAASHNELIAMVSSASKEPALYGWRADPDDEEQQKGAWQTLWDSKATGTEIDSILVSTAYDVYRLWWSYGGRIYWLTLPRDVINPLELSTYTYAAAGEVITPWLDGQEISDAKNALELFVNAISASSNETIAVDYEINDSGSFVNLGTISTAGVTTYTLGATSGQGIAFRRIRFRFTFARGGTDTLTPDLGKVEFHWLRPLDVKWRHTFTIKWEGIDEYGFQAEAQLDKLINAASSTLLLDFTFRSRTEDDDSEANAYNHFVKVVAIRILTETGDFWDGTAQITVEEI